MIARKGAYQEVDMMGSRKEKAPSVKGTDGALREMQAVVGYAD
jgi:hypothetical protein